MRFPELICFLSAKNEIYNSRVVPRLQISKRAELSMIYMFVAMFFFSTFCLDLILGWTCNANGLGEVGGGRDWPKMIS